MSPEVVVYVLTALAVVVIALTRLRLGRDQGAGRLDVGYAWLGAHTVVGVMAVLTWTVFLVAPEDNPAGGPAVGIAALGLWWVVALCGLMILVRWLPSKGRHAQTGTEDSWSQGPGLSVLAHLGMVVGVGVFTWAYLTAAV